MLLDPPIELIELNIPEFGEPIVQPIVPKATYDARILEALGRAKNLRLDAVVIYGEREHNGSMTYLARYDPRFEEALLVLKTNHEPTRIVGNEGWGYSELVPIAHRRVLFQSFSLMGQPRGDSKSLPRILKEAGLSFTDRVGLAGWKHFDAQDGMTETDFEVPSYIVDCMRGLVAELVNAGPIFSNPRYGMRVINDVDQLAVFEHASTFTSQGLRNVLFQSSPGYD